MLSVELPGSVVGKKRAALVANRMMRTRTPHARERYLADLAAWRRRQLERAGFDAGLAEELAWDRRADVHGLIELVERGCPPSLAVRILAPLERIEEASH